MKVLIRGEETDAPQYLRDKQVSGLFESVVSYKLNATRGQASTISKEDADFDLTEIQFADDTTWIGGTEELKELFGIEVTRGDADASEDYLQIPESLSLVTERGIGEQLKTKLISFMTYKAVEIGALAAAKQIDESKVKTPGLYKIDYQFKPIRNLQKENVSDKSVLVFIHGTMSCFENAFEAIGKGDDGLWGNIKKIYEDRIYAFEHHTLSVSPLENTLQLIRELPDNVNLHLITHSRGGIIGDILCKCDTNQSGFSKQEIELFEKYKLKDSLRDDHQIASIKELNEIRRRKKFTVQNYIRVACPGAGTRLLSRRMDCFFNILNNVFRLSGVNLIASGIGDMFLHLIKQKENPMVLPGLAAMVPDSAFQKLLNNPDCKVHNKLSIVYSNAGQGNLLSRGISFLIRRFIFNRDNDFVVDLSSMFFGVQRAKIIRGLEIKNPSVGHSSYFANNQFRESLIPELQSKHSISKFSETKVGDSNRSIEFIPRGKYMSESPTGKRPIVVVLPGILGSVLSKDNDVKWLDYSDMLLKGINELKLDKNQKSDIKATHLIGTSYRDLCEYLIDNGYDVVSFPYDWRQAIQVEGKRLAITLEALMRDYPAQPIKILAHSMGGLIMKDVIVHHKQIYDELCDRSGFRFIMLGTPWKGSYMITQFLTAQGKRFRALEKISILQGKEEILKTSHTFPGILNLLPVGREKSEIVSEKKYDLSNLKVWKEIKKASGEDFWLVPDKELLLQFKNYVKTLNAIDLDPKYVKYVAGKAKQTVNGMTVGDTEQKAFSVINASKIQYTCTPAGDGSVTWRFGIPSEFQETNLFSETTYTDNVSFVDATHGDLSNEASLFKGYLDLLRYGETTESEFSSTPPQLVMRGEETLDDVHILPNNKEDLWSMLLGSDPTNQFNDEDEKRTIAIQFSCGHLKRAVHPILVGHQTSPSIKGSEHAVDDVLKGKLTQLIKLGLYPNDVETSEVILTNNKGGFKGAIIVGTGAKENQTGYLLERSVEKAVLKYLLTVSTQNKSNGELGPTGKLGLSSVFMSSYYGGLSLNVSMDSIINGVSRANEAMRLIKLDDWISEIEFVEIYEDRCEQAMLGLIDMNKRKLLNVPVNITKACVYKEGRKLSLPIDHNFDWYTRYSITSMAEENNFIEGLLFRSAAGLAREEVKEEYTDKQMLDLLVDIIPESKFNHELSKALFELLIPNEFKTNFRRQGNILLVLDKITASYPWEMMVPELDLHEPLAVKASMIRQFSTEDYRSQLNFITDKTAFIIGNPATNGVHIDLPEARAETDEVVRLLQSKEYKTYYPDPDSIQPQEYIIKLLAQDYKIIHIAAHGVYQDEDNFAKIIIGPKEGDIITPLIFSKMKNTPEIAFINCCHIGRIDVAKEDLIRKRYKIASSIGAQLLSQGFKAVIVAGWAVNDAAAKTFASHFYSQMLEGSDFGHAVQVARKECYRHYPHTNTWGAYHCYGDPEYKLESVGKSSSYDDTIYIKQQARISIRNFRNNAKHNKVRSDSSVKRLHEIAYKIENSNFTHDPELIELLAFAYAEILEWEAAIKLFNNLFQNENAGYTFKAYEKYHNIKVRYAYKEIKKLQQENKKIEEVKTIAKRNSPEESDKIVEKANQNLKKNKKLIASIGLQIRSSIDDLQNLYEEQATIERCSLIGSAYQRRYALFGKKDDLNQMIDRYKKAYFKCDTQKVKNYHYSLIILLKAYYFQNNEICKDNDPIIQMVSDSHEKLILLLEKELKLIQNSTEFWDEIAMVSLYQYQLIISKSTKSVQKHFDNMKVTFSNAWDIGGAVQHLSTEIEHMDFLLCGINNQPDTQKLKTTKRKYLEEYIDYLQEFGNGLDG